MVLKCFSYISGVAPKLPKISSINLTDSGYEIKATAGTLPMTLKAYIDRKSFKKHIGYDYGKDFEITVTSEDIARRGIYIMNDSFINIEQGYDDNGLSNGTATLKFPARPNHYDDDIKWPNISYKNLPITVVATNAQGTAKATYKINVTGDAPEWSYSYYTENPEAENEDKAPKAITIPLRAGTHFES